MTASAPLRGLFLDKETELARETPRPRVQKIKKTETFVSAIYIGAGSGNRTRTISLEG